MGVCMCGGESERGPPCGCAAYMWICGIVCVVAGERERESGGGEGGEGVGSNNNNPSSKPLDKHNIDSSKDKTRGGHGAVRRCLVKGHTVLNTGATNSTLPKNLHNSQGFKDIHGNLHV